LKIIGFIVQLDVLQRRTMCGTSAVSCSATVTMFFISSTYWNVLLVVHSFGDRGIYYWDGFKRILLANLAQSYIIYHDGDIYSALVLEVQPSLIMITSHIRHCDANPHKSHKLKCQTCWSQKSLKTNNCLLILSSTNSAYNRQLERRMTSIVMIATHNSRYYFSRRDHPRCHQIIVSLFTNTRLTKFQHLQVY
jgi:hypothetical protein